MGITNSQRFAVFTVHRGRCWICNSQVAFNEMEVEHILPSSLRDNPDIDGILQLYGRNREFELDSYENWMPSHRRCNGFKGDTILEPTPLVQIWLQKAAAAANDARRIEKQAVNEKELDRSIARVLSAVEQGRLNHSQRRAIKVIARFFETVRHDEDKGKPFDLVAGLRVIADNGHYLVLQSPSGIIGHRPSGDNVHHSFDCPFCGPTAWDGSRCIKCNRMIDLD